MKYIKEKIKDTYLNKLYGLPMSNDPGSPILFNTDIYTISFYDKNTKGGIQIIDTETKEILKGKTFYNYNKNLNQKNIVFKMPNQEQLNLGEIGVIITFDTADGWKKIDTGLNFLIDHDDIKDNPTFIYGVEERYHSLKQGNKITDQKMTGFDIPQITETIASTEIGDRSLYKATAVYLKKSTKETFDDNDKKASSETKIYSDSAYQLCYLKKADSNEKTRKFDGPTKYNKVPGYSQDLHWFGFSGN